MNKLMSVKQAAASFLISIPHTGHNICTALFIRDEQTLYDCARQGFSDANDGRQCLQYPSRHCVDLYG